MPGRLAPAVDTLLTRYFDSYRSRRFDEHLDCYSSEALIVLGDRIVPRSTLSPADYEQAMAASAGSSYALLETKTVSQDGADAVARCSVQLNDRVQDLLAWCRLEAGDWRLVGWAMPDKTITSLTKVKAHVWAELGARDGRLAFHPFALLSARHLPSDDPALLCLPESRFTCQDRGECCHIGGWRVTVPDETAHAASRLDWPNLRPELDGKTLFQPVDQGLRHAIQPNSDGSCPFHLPMAHDRHGCALHATLGHPLFRVCDSYPFMFTETPDGICVFTSYVCRTSASNQGERIVDRQDNLRSKYRRMGSRASVSERVIWDRWERAVSWPTYRSIEARFLQALDSREQTIHERLLECYRYLALLDMEVPSEDLEWADRTWAELQGLAPMKSVTLSGIDDLSARLIEEMASCEGMQVQTIPCLPSDWGPEGEDTLTRFLRKTLFQKDLLGDAGAVLSIQLLFVAYRAVLGFAGAHAVLKGSQTCGLDDLYPAIRAHDRARLHQPAAFSTVFVEGSLGDRLRDLATGAEILGLN